MRALLERSRPARSLVALLAFAAVFGLAHAATAGSGFGLRNDMLWPEPEAEPVRTLVPVADPVEVPRRHRHARRIWAAARSRPLRSARARMKRPTRTIEARRTARLSRAGPVRSASEAPVVFANLIKLPKPPKPAVVSIYEDRTLRNGDAVMMVDGIHIFQGLGEWPYRPRNFVRLTLTASLGWHLRQTLDALDRNPPTRWSSNGPPTG